MKFCNTCDNMMYITTEKRAETNDDNDAANDDGDNDAGQASTRLVYHCKCCNNRVVSNEKSVVITQHQYKDDATSYKQFISPFIKHDPTLPRVNNIHCIHADCKGKNDTQETIYIKYDNANMKYIYYCCHCERWWKAE